MDIRDRSGALLKSWRRSVGEAGEANVLIRGRGETATESKPRPSSFRPRLLLTIYLAIRSDDEALYLLLDLVDQTVEVSGQRRERKCFGEVLEVAFCVGDADE